MPRLFGPVLLAAVAGIGGFKAIPAVANFSADVTVLLVGITAALSAWTVAQARFTIPSVAFKPLLLLVSLAPATIWASWSPYSSTKIGLLFTVSAVCLVAPIVLIQNRQQLRTFMVAVAGIGLVLVVASLLAPADLSATRMAAFDASELHLASFGGALFVISVLWAATRRARVPVGLGLAGISIIAVIGSGTRAAVAGGLAALMISLVAARGQGLRRVAKVIVLVPVVGAAVAYGLQVAPVQARHRLEAAVYDVSADRSAGTRLDAWQQSLDMMGAYPFGVGIGDWPEHAEGHLTYPHNLLLEVGAETGWLGLVAILLFLTLAFRIVWRYSATTEGQMLLGLLSFLVLQAMFRGDISSHRLLFIVASTCLALPRILETHEDDEGGADIRNGGASLRVATWSRGHRNGPSRGAPSF